MRVNASAGRSPKADLRRECWSLRLRAVDAEEAAMLARVHAAILSDGPDALTAVGETSHAAEEEVQDG